MQDEVCIPITEDVDLIPARAEGRALAQRQGFSRTDTTLIATAISEIARNIVVHAGRGEILLRAIDDGPRRGILVIARDEGPGIEDVRRAVETGVATGGGLGLGLPGARRLMDDFDIESSPAAGTTVTMVKWRVRDELERLRERRSGDAPRG
jgi:serine/threonine-protein kinase RsbT